MRSVVIQLTPCDERRPFVRSSVATNADLKVERPLLHEIIDGLGQRACQAMLHS
jgi:hypothetical protein